jgi:hypothetical protein
VKLFRFPLEAVFLWLLWTLSCRFVERLVSSGENHALWEILGDDRYGSEKSGSRSSHPWRSAVFRVCRSITIS